MVLPLGRPGRQQSLLRLRREGEEILEEELGGVRFVPLVAGLPAEGARGARQEHDEGLRDSGPDRQTLS